MDAILELDSHLRVTQMNAAAEKIFGCKASQIVGQAFAPFLCNENQDKLINLTKSLDTCPEEERYLWIPGGLWAISAGGQKFSVEATLSRFGVQRQTFYTLILRNVNDQLEAAQKIRSLTVKAAYLRGEVKALHHFDEIIRQSKPLLQMLDDVTQLAETDATVLIFEETGTGKELITRAIHNASLRHDKPLIKVNCAAIPATLIESKLFSHEKGAFTGATQRRDGCFVLADGGAIFLDEAGELPLELQAKLLRVLQEGAFKPAGKSQTKQVDVRVIAATNRDLYQMVQAGEFREDFYYRFNVFPTEIPPFREHNDDIPRLASAFAEEFAQK